MLKHFTIGDAHIKDVTPVSSDKVADDFDGDVITKYQITRSRITPVNISPAGFDDVDEAKKFLSDLMLNNYWADYSALIAAMAHITFILTASAHVPQVPLGTTINDIAVSVQVFVKPANPQQPYPDVVTVQMVITPQNCSLVSIK